MTTASDARFDVQPTVSNHFSWINTMLSLERTLMAATRTAVSLIGFGFTVAQFFQRTRDSLPEQVRRMRPEGPRDFGLALIAAGIISLALFAWQFHEAAVRMHSGVYEPIAGPRSRLIFAPVYVVAIAVMVIGIAAFAVVFARL
jgi:putative membrane protein